MKEGYTFNAHKAQPMSKDDSTPNVTIRFEEPFPLLSGDGWERASRDILDQDAERIFTALLLALPGGIGTFEEFFEVWTWRQLGYHDKPIGLLNTAGYYDGLLEFAKNSVTAGFLSDWQMDLIRSGDDPVQLLKDLVQAAGFSPAPKLAEL